MAAVLRAVPRHSNRPLPLLPSGPDGIHSVSMRGDPKDHHREPEILTEDV